MLLLFTIFRPLQSKSKAVLCFCCGIVEDQGYVLKNWCTGVVEVFHGVLIQGTVRRGKSDTHVA